MTPENTRRSAKQPVSIKSVSDSDSHKIKDLSFEEGLDRLNQIVSDIRSLKTPLEQLVDQYEEGYKLLTHCQKKLQSAEQKVTLIRKKHQKDNLQDSPSASPDEETDDDEASLF